MSKIAQLVLVITTLILTGCGMHHKEVSMGDGTTAYEISCGGSMRSYADCRNYAAEICNGKYKELDKEEYTQEIDNYYTGEKIKRRDRKMSVVCK